MVWDAYDALQRNLLRARRMLIRGHVGLWLLRAVTLSAAILFASTAIVLLVGTESVATAVLGLLVVIGLPALILFAIVFPSLRIPTLEKVAIMTDRLEGDKNTLVSSLQLGRRMAELSPYYSKAVIEAVVREGEVMSEGTDFRKLLPARKLRSWSIACSSTTLALVAFLVLMPGAYEPSFFSIVSRPFEEGVSVSIKPGDIEVGPGENVRVRVIVKGSLSEPRLRLKAGRDSWNYVGLDRVSAQAPGSTAESVFEKTIQNIEMSTLYSAELGKKETPVYEISVRTPPEVSEFLITYEFPDYAGIEKRVVRSMIGDISALKGTRVLLDIKFSGKPSSAGVLFDNKKLIPLKASGNEGLTTSFSLGQNGTYRVMTTDKRGKEYLSPPYEIRSQEDLAPFIKVISPAIEADLGESMELPIEVVCADDYGLTTLRLRYFRDPADARAEEIRVFNRRTKEAAVIHHWDLAPLQLLPGESVKYFLEIADNDVVSGPKTARTALMTARVPTLAQLYSGMEQQQDERITDLEQILDDAQTMSQELEKISRELRQESELSWERKKEVENLQKAYSNIAENIDRVTQALESDTEKLEAYDPTSFELGRKISEVRKLLESIQNPEFKASIRRLQDAMAKLGLTETDKALADYAITQEELLKGLDRAIELLKQIKLEEKLQAAIEKAVEMSKRQGEIDEELDGKEPDYSGASQEQSNLKQSLDELRQELEEMGKESRDNELSKMLEEIANSISKAGLSDKMSQAAEMLRSKKTSGLRRLMNLIKGGLNDLVVELTGVQQGYSSRQLADVTEKVRRAMHELVRLSKDQEELSMRSGNEAAEDLAMRQQSIIEGTSAVADRLFEISKESVFMSQATAEALGTAIRTMQRAQKSFEDNVKGGGLLTGRQAYQSLNSVLSSLLLAEQSMCSGQGQGMGMGQSFQRMRALAGLQEGINKTVEELYSVMSKQGRLSNSEEETLARLAAQQEAVRKGMEEVSRAMGERRDILGRLEDIIDEMKNVETQMQAKQLDQTMIHRQSQILSRLLDAQRSAQQQDYSGKRYSRPGKDFPDRQSPPELPREMLGQSEKIRLDMLRERTDRYPESYRALVEEYMKALSGSAK